MCISRYYDPEIGRFISPDSIDYLDPESINGLNLYTYCLNNSISYYDPTGHAPWWSWAISGLQLAAGIGLLFVPGAQGLGISLIVGGGLGLIANAAAPAVGQFIGGGSSMVNGYGAISTGLGLLSFGPVGWVLGGALMFVGGVTMAFGANEMVAAVSGTNYIQQWTGMSDTAYGWTYFGLNLTSAAGTIAGQYYMKYNPPYPGNNPNKTPNGFNDRANSKANYYNPKTKQSLGPDLNHLAPIKPHWDWKDSNGVWWRLYRFYRKLK